MVGLMEDLMVIVLNSRWMNWMEVVVGRNFTSGWW